MAVFTFLCSDETQEECFSRKLFGGKPGYQKTVEKVQPGDSLLLYNYSSKTLHGVFRALSAGQQNIVPEAWKGQYPWQVRVERVKEYAPLKRSLFDRDIPFKDYPPRELTLKEFETLIKIFSEDHASDDGDDCEVDHPHIPTNDGHLVRSQGEKAIDDWLFERCIPHVYEKPIAIGRTDFVIPRHDGDVYIEFWGRDDKNYLKRKNQKLRWYKENGIHLVELFPKDIKHLDEILASQLFTDGVVPSPCAAGKGCMMHGNA